MSLGDFYFDHHIYRQSAKRKWNAEPAHFYYPLPASQLLPVTMIMADCVVRSMLLFAKIQRNFHQNCVIKSEQFETIAILRAQLS